jgi:hypothetical protein
MALGTDYQVASGLCQMGWPLPSLSRLYLNFVVFNLFRFHGLSYRLPSGKWAVPNGLALDTTHNTLT